MPKRDKWPETIEELVQDGVDELKERKTLIKRIEVLNAQIDENQAELKEIQVQLSDIKYVGLNANKLLVREIEKRVLEEVQLDAE